MQSHAVAKYVLHGLMALMILVQPVLPVLAMTKPEDAAALLVSDAPETMMRPSRAADARVTEAKVASPLVNVARQRVAAQEAYEAPTPVAVEETLPPGTIKEQSEETLSKVFLPLISNASPLAKLTREIEDLRTRYSKTFQRPDGSGYALVYMEPIHYKTGLGTWLEIDNSLVRDPDKINIYRNAANDFDIELSTPSTENRNQGLDTEEERFLNEINK